MREIRGEHSHRMPASEELTAELPHRPPVAAHLLRRQQIRYDEDSPRLARLLGRDPTGAFAVARDRAIVEHAIVLECLQQLPRLRGATRQAMRLADRAIR